MAEMTGNLLGKYLILILFLYSVKVVAPNRVETTGGIDCVFPYIYQGQMYYACINANHDRPWCALTPNYDSDGRWSNCISEDIATIGGRGDIPKCFFPFQYNGVDRYECINDAHNTTWCGTTRNFDTDRLWGNCGATALQTTEGNSYGAPCCLPYVYMGVEFTGCNSFDTRFNKAWCATTPNYDTDKQWGYCVVKTFGGEKSNGANCVFPYRYKGREYGRCQTTPGDSLFRPWCGTTYDYDRDGAWGYCIMQSTLKCEPSGAVTMLPGLTTTVPPNITTSISQPTRNSCAYRRFPDTNALGGVPSSGAQSVEACMRQCDDASDCVALDFDMNDNTRSRCWHHFDSDNLLDENVGVAIGVDHYRQLACSGRPVSTCQFDQRNNTNSFGAISVPDATTPDQCRSRCILDQQCLAYEWESNPNPTNRVQCFIHRNQANVDRSVTSPDKTITQFIKQLNTC